jgi:hypothetical protein
VLDECELRKSIMKIPHIVTNGYSAYIQNGNLDDEVWIMRLRNSEDIKAISAYANTISDGRCNLDLTDEDIGKLIALDFSNDLCWCECTKIKEYLEAINSTYDRYEKRVDEEIINKEKEQNK